MLNKDLHLSSNIYNANIKMASTRQGFGDALLELGENNDKIVVLTADLKESTKVGKFAEKFPSRFIEVGVAEQNMTGVAAGLALGGKIPFITSYAAFTPGGNWSQIRMSICYSNLNVKIIGSHSGFSAARDGTTHQSFEDISLARILPNLVIFSPADYEQTKKAVNEAARIVGPVYIRTCRNESPVFTTSKTPFTANEAQILKEGSDITLISTGQMVYESLLAAYELETRDKISVEVINVHTIEPLDEEVIIASAKKTGLVLTIEEHQISGGLGSAVLETLAENHPTYVYRMGLKDSFGESGEREELLEKYKLNKKHVVEKVKGLKFGKK